jgi:ABC-type bacteriocin/lantibiotic exporter with double-glycine peptidase domain
MEYRYQVNNWECGVRALQNALVTLGIEADRKEIKISTGCTRSSGTSKRGIFRGVIQYDCQPSRYQTHDPNLAWRWIYKWASRTPCIVLLDEMEHWALISGTIANKVILIDSSQQGSDLIGTSPLTKKELLDRWIGGGVYYAIRVTKN